MQSPHTCQVRLGNHYDAAQLALNTEPRSAAKVHRPIVIAGRGP